jgi:hypothetical protein
MRTSLSKPGKLILVPVSIVLAVIMIVVMLPVAASADIHSVCRLYGPITLNNVNVSLTDTTITAWIEGSSAGPWTQLSLYREYAQSWYTIDIPEDLSGVSGGKDGDVIHFSIITGGNSYTAGDKIWHKTQTYYHLHLVQQPDPVITTDAMPDGTVGVNYSAIMEANSGTTPYTWSETGLTTDLVLSDDGNISGKPNPGLADFAQFTIANNNTWYCNVDFTVTDTEGRTDAKTLPIKIVWTIADANGDGKIDMADVSYLQLVMLGARPITPGCDANRNGYVGMDDIGWIEIIILSRP